MALTAFYFSQGNNVFLEIVPLINYYLYSSKVSKHHGWVHALEMEKLHFEHLLTKMQNTFKMSHSYDCNMSITVISQTYVVAFVTDWTIYGTDLRMYHEIRLISSTLTIISVCLNKLSLILSRNLPKGELLLLILNCYL